MWHPNTNNDQLSERIADAELSEVRSFLHTVVAQAANTIKEMREQGALQEKLKNPRDLVTAADVAAEKIIIDGIKQRFPNDQILSEETFSDTSRPDILKQRCWIIDPIDGTVNYAHGLPLVGISIGFGYGDRVRYGMVALPFMDRVYEAALGCGAYLNGAPIKPSTRSELQESLVATGFPYSRDKVEELVERVRRILTHCQDIRRLGAASIDLCLVADGSIEAYTESVKPWDMAAGVLIAREAGAMVDWLQPQIDQLPPDLWCKGLLVAAPSVFDKMKSLFGN